jgi:hypothetical protein
VPDGILPSMTRASLSRLTLVADDRPAPRSSAVVRRRYRLARLDLNGRLPDADDRFSYLKRVHD